MKVKTLNESILNIFKKKQQPLSKMMPLTVEQRQLIKKNFKSSNALEKYGDEQSQYVLPFNANATHGKGTIAFRNESDVLIANVSYHASKEDALNPKVSPMASKDIIIKDQNDLDKLKSDLEE